MPPSVALAVPCIASADYNVPATASCNGAFGALGAKSVRHDLGQGDTSPTGSVKVGAYGPATGAANSAHVCT